MASCQDYTAGYYAAHRSIAADELDLVLFLGDYIYEYASGPDAVRQVPGGKCITLGGLPEPLRPLQVRREPPGRPRQLPLDRHLGRPRGREQPRRAEQRGGDKPRGLRRAASSRLPGLLRASAGAARPSRRSRLAHLPDRPLGHTGRLLRARRAAVPRRPAVRCPSRRRSRPHHLRSGRRGSHDVGRRAGGLAPRRPVGGVRRVEGPRPADRRLRACGRRHHPQRRPVGRLSTRRAAASSSTSNRRASPTSSCSRATSTLPAPDALRVDPDDPDSTPVAVELVCTSISSEGLAEAVGLDPNTLDPTSFGLDLRRAPPPRLLPLHHHPRALDHRVRHRRRRLRRVQPDRRWRRPWSPRRAPRRSPFPSPWRRPSSRRPTGSPRAGPAGLPRPPSPRRRAVRRWPPRTAAPPTAPRRAPAG